MSAKDSARKTAESFSLPVMGLLNWEFLVDAPFSRPRRDPEGLRDPLLAEYNSIVSHYLEAKWKPSELSGGLFCEIVYTILDGYGKSSYAGKPTKPSDFPSACRALEQHANSPRSFRILIPRALPALYEVRNNRNVGHVGGDVDPNEMDASLVLHTTAWVMAELIRVFHRKMSFQDELRALLRKHEIEWDEKYVWD